MLNALFLIVQFAHAHTHQHTHVTQERCRHMFSLRFKTSIITMNFAVRRINNKQIFRQKESKPN